MDTKWLKTGGRKEDSEWISSELEMERWQIIDTQTQQG